MTYGIGLGLSGDVHACARHGYLYSCNPLYRGLSAIRACAQSVSELVRYCLVAGMASTITSRTRVCRLCCVLVASNRAVSLFGAAGSKHQWPSRIEDLLSVPVGASDGLSSYICQKCKVWIMSLEKAAADLKAFKELASCSRFTVERIRGPLKRPKRTSSDIGVSPDTARQRPRPKILKKRL